MDYGHDLHFGVFLSPDAERYDDVLTAAAEADVLGLDSVSVQDHPYQPAFLDTWTLLAQIAARTERISVFSNVANLPLRHPRSWPAASPRSTSCPEAGWSSAWAPVRSGTRSRHWADRAAHRVRRSTRSRRRSA